MTTTPQVDLAEARELAEDFCAPYWSDGSPNQMLMKAADTIRALADEVEALRNKYSLLIDAHAEELELTENLRAELASLRLDTAQVQKLLVENACMQSELAALKAVGPDGLPPLPEQCDVALVTNYQGQSEYRRLHQDWCTFSAKFCADQMRAYARAAIAAQQPVEVTDEQIIGLLKASYGANMMVMKSDIEFAREVLALAQKGGE